MKPIVVLGVVQPYPGYGCEQVTIVASRIPDRIVAFGQTRRNILISQEIFLWSSMFCYGDTLFFMQKTS
jgi:hypothetical protein